ncbi:MAG: VOC family protein [Caldilineaceae bacterium]|nr:VOC family protein [Caldilineaceae bacterium]
MTTMKLNHLNVCVTDPRASSQFFVDYFGFQRANTNGLDTLAVLHGEDHFVLILSNFDKQNVPVYPNGFHFGFIRESQGEVDAMYARLAAAGFATEAPRAVHGSWSFYFNAPGDILVEVQAVLPR